jgi:hypothetical protein
MRQIGVWLRGMDLRTRQEERLEASLHSVSTSAELECTSAQANSNANENNRGNTDHPRPVILLWSLRTPK